MITIGVPQLMALATIAEALFVTIFIIGRGDKTATQAIATAIIGALYFAIPLVLAVMVLIGGTE